MGTTTAPSGPLLAEPDDLAELLKVPVDHPGMRVALELASEQFRGDTRRHITLTVEDEVVCDGDGSTVLLLPDAPIRQLRSVTVCGDDVTDEVEHSPQAAILRRRAGWPDRLGAITVIYDHGFDEVPGDIAAAVIGQARVIYTSNPGLSSMTVGGQSLVFTSGAAGIGGGVTEAWTRAVQRWQLRSDRA